MQASYDSLVQSLSFLDPEAVPDQDQDAPSQQHNEQDMRQAIGAHMLRRLRSQVATFSPPTCEVVLPVMMTQQQRECYKAQLARAYEILTDPKTPRQNSHRGGQLRMVCSSLKKVVSNRPGLSMGNYCVEAIVADSLLPLQVGDQPVSH